MRSKIPALFSINNHINILSTILFWGVFGFYQTYQTKENRSINFSGLLVLILIIIIYGIIYFLGTKLVSQYNRQIYSKDPKKAIRIVFYIFEFLLFFLYSYLAYTIFLSMKLTNFYSLADVNWLKLIALIAFYTGYISSIFRLFLTWPFFRMVKNQNIYLLDSIGEIEAT